MVERSSLWALQNCLMIRNLIYVIEDPEKKSLVLHVLNQFDQLVLPKIDCLEKGIIHGDFNEHNIIVEDDKVISLIDFGDSQYAPVLFEIAICLCYIILQGQHFEMCKHVLEGLKTRRILTSLEITLLKISICARLCQSLVLGLYTYSKDPNNKYVLSSQINGWKQLQMLVPMEQAVLENSWNLEGHNENQ
ncbi:hypothetical protein AAG570_012852 [Ranatra chinensis]|uniref:Hydroxylysine kinase n=1 Tax=Ranatra chinensis TaxID=642074 RepID=A0ABD0Z1A5_9HEMI